jgi:hypothetical protein
MVKVVRSNQWTWDAGLDLELIQEGVVRVMQQMARLRFTSNNSNNKYNHSIPASNNQLSITVPQELILIMSTDPAHPHQHQPINIVSYPFLSNPQSLFIALYRSIIQ